jgi:hypothetical protein
MSAALSRSKTRRTVAAASAVALGLVALSACEKPTPQATVTAGADSVSAGAACYNDGKQLDQKKLGECIGKKSGNKLTVSEGEKVRVGVEPEIADSGWAMVVNGQGTMTEASKATYRSFDFDQIFAAQQSPTGGAAAAPKTAQVAIIQLNDAGQAKGAWEFTLKRSS